MERIYGCFLMVATLNTKSYEEAVRDFSFSINSKPGVPLRWII